jgi:hypothetical protein
MNLPRSDAMTEPLLTITIARNDAGQFVAQDDGPGLYGSGQTVLRALVEYVSMLRGTRNDARTQDDNTAKSSAVWFEKHKEIAVDYVTHDYRAAEGTMMRATREVERTKAELDAVTELKKEDVSGYPWRGAE